MWYAITFILWVVIIYTFMGIFAFIPYFIWVLYGAFMFPIEFINQVIYPVGVLPYIFLTAWLCFVWLLTVFHLVFWKTK